MPMKFACPSCKAPLTVPDSAAGKTGPCPKCRATITAPTVTPPTVTSPRPAIGMDGSPDGARQQARVPNSRAPAQLGEKEWRGAVKTFAVEVLIAFILALFIGAFIYVSEQREKERQARLTPEQRIAESARSRFGDATLVQYPSPGYVVVECVPDGVHLGGIHDYAVIDVVKKFKGFVQWAFQVEGVNVVELQGYTLAQDVYGHRGGLCVIRLSIPRHVAARFDWTRATLGGFAQVLQDDPECQAFVHKSGSRGWGLTLRTHFGD